MPDLAVCGHSVLVIKRGISICFLKSINHLGSFNAIILLPCVKRYIMSTCVKLYYLRSVAYIRVKSVFQHSIVCCRASDNGQIRDTCLCLFTRS